MYINMGVAPKLRKRCRAIPVRTGTGGHFNLFLRRSTKKGFSHPNGFIRAGVAIPYAWGGAVLLTGKANNPKGMEFVFIYVNKLKDYED